MNATVQVLVRVEPKLKRAIDRAVKREATTMQAFVIEAVRERLERLASAE